jgi:DNA ligase (NAD+)
MIDHAKNDKNDKIARIHTLTKTLGEAAKAYYKEDREIMSNLEYDALYDELAQLEQETGIVMSDSPTIRVGYEAATQLPKETHATPMLSLNKTKDREELLAWLGTNEAVLSWKLDGLTIVLTYQDGKLTKAVTRGNGEIGEVITNNAKTFRNLPARIPFADELVLRGEAIITYSDFELVNAKIPEISQKYKNPRNLCSGSVRQLNNEITAQRNVNFYAFSLVRAGETPLPSKFAGRLDFLQMLGFSVVERKLVTQENLLAGIESFERRIKTFDIPTDGLVLTYDDCAYGASLGRTSKFPHDAIAFKWKDEQAQSTLREVEWSASRTGLLNPVAIFDPVELEGTTVTRASLHNVSIVRSLQLGIGDQVLVYKANMIIPQIAQNITKSDTLQIPDTCPICTQAARIHQIGDVQSLYCENPRCPAKHLHAFVHFVSRDAMNLDGISEASLAKWIEQGFIEEFADLFELERWKEEIIALEGFGERSFQKLKSSIDAARQTTLPKLLYALGIENIGLSTAKLICTHFSNDPDCLQAATKDELTQIDGVGEVIATAFVDYMQDDLRRQALKRLLEKVTIERADESESQRTFALAGKIFVITGSLEHFENRNELKDRIEKEGGKVASSVSAKTTALINNDLLSPSSKNQKAKELGVPILSEDEFLLKYNLA